MRFLDQGKSRADAAAKYCDLLAVVSILAYVFIFACVVPKISGTLPRPGAELPVRFLGAPTYFVGTALHAFSKIGVALAFGLFAAGRILMAVAKRSRRKPDAPT
jgi:type II secretory pathway component PulF